MTLTSVMNIVMVVLAFGFVIFWHELGHFLAARWAGVRVEQFAVGMGHALFSWRKGIGFRFGNTQKEFEKRVQAEYERRNREANTGRLFSSLSVREQYDIAKDIGIGETEYRLSWIPLGGYVKPTGQDDLRPAAEVGADDPKAFGAKSVGKRMVIISAGVIMNVILAFGLYVALFLYGFKSSPAVVGGVQAGSPAADAGLRVGDRVLKINGANQEDFTKLTMNVALLREDEPAEFVVLRPGVPEPIVMSITPRKTPVSYNMPSIGVHGPSTLVGAVARDRANEVEMVSDDDDFLPAGAKITQINGTDVLPNEYYKLETALQSSAGKPVELTIVTADGKTSTRAIKPALISKGFGASDLTILGMQPRAQIMNIVKKSPAHEAGIQRGDVIAQIAIAETADALAPPALTDFIKWINEAGQKGKSIRITVIRDGKTLDPITIAKTQSRKEGRMIGVTLDYEMSSTIISSVGEKSAAATAGLRPGDRIVTINGKPVENWYGLIESFRSVKAGVQQVTVDRRGEQLTLAVSISDSDLQALGDLRYAHTLPLAPLIEPRHTTNPLTAAKWGVEETKFSIFQVYLTLQRLIQRSVPLSNLSGPLGILSAGSNAADRGLDWLIWFTALISANLAVVNFLPIPIVDGGLFIFLLAEKFTGKPPSPRVQTAAQVLGLVLLGSLFLFVTYHDVLRMIG